MEEEETCPFSLRSETFSLRIVTLDYYLSRPHPSLDICFSSFQGQPVAEVPVVRIFGTTLTGQKICLHLHKAFPYFYVPYDQDLPQDLNEALAFVRRLASAVEKALKLASTAGAKRQHIHSCSLVRANKFYGFHLHEQLFVKIVLYYPQEVSRLSSLLLGGGILNRHFQPHESHVPYLLQVMIDHNLAGMGHLHLSDIKFRQPVLESAFTHVSSTMPKFQSLTSTLWRLDGQTQVPSCHMELWCKIKDTKIDSSQVIMPDKQSTCELEADASIEAVLNRQELSFAPLSKGGPEVKMVQSLIPIWEELALKDEDFDADMKNLGLPERCVEDAPYTRDFKNVFEHMFNARDEENGDSLFGTEAMLTAGGESAMTSKLSQSSQTSAGDSHQGLLMCTQAAHFKKSNLFEETDGKEARPCPNMNNLEGIEILPKNAKGDPLVDEDMIKHQISQSSQDTDEEAMELLRWMINSQQEGSVTAYESDHEKVEDESSWSQVFQTADEALAKAVQEYEQFSQQECQAIIDCSQGSPDEMLSIGQGFKTSKEEDKVAGIPQFDGACDEDQFHDSDEKTNAEKKQAGFHDSDVKTNAGKKQAGWGPFSISRQKSWSAMEAQPSTNFFSQVSDSTERGYVNEGHEEEESLRDLMRRKRKAKQSDELSLQHASFLPPIILGEKVVPSGVTRSFPDIDYNSKEVPSQRESLKGKDLEENRPLKKTLVGEIQAKHKPHKKLQTVAETVSRFCPLPITWKSGLTASTLDAISRDKLSTSESSLAVPCSVKDFTTNEESLTSLENTERDENCNIDNAPSTVASCSKAQGANWGEEKHGDFMLPNVLSQQQEVGFEEVEHTFPVLEGKREGASFCKKSLDGIFQLREPDSAHAIVDDKAGSSPISTDNVAKVVAIRKRMDCRCEGGVFTFHKKPPTMENLRTSFDMYDLPMVDHGGVFYGRSEDLPAQPAVMAGLAFEAKSREVEFLKEFQFANNMKARTVTRIYGSSSLWRPTMEDESAVGLPSHFQNDGTVLYLLTPVKVPPTFDEVSSWLKQQPTFNSTQHELAIEQSCNSLENGANSQRSWMESESPIEDSQFLRPPSPKYDECHMLPCQIGTCDRTVTGPSDQSPQYKVACDIPYTSKDADNVSCGEEKNRPTLSPSKLANKETQTFAIPIKKVLQLQQGNRQDVSQLSGHMSGGSHFTPLSQAGFRDPASAGCGQQISIMSVEVFARTRGDLLPDPRYDAISCIVAVVQDDNDHERCMRHTVILLHDKGEEAENRNKDALSADEVIMMKDEASLLRMFIWLVRIYDPDLLVGWEIQGFSLGLLAERAANLGIELLKEISRTPVNKNVLPTKDKNVGEAVHMQVGMADVPIIDDEWGRTHGSGIYVTGRIVLNLWRVMRGEIKLGIYTLEAVAEAVLKRKVPSIPWRTLTSWFVSGQGGKRYCCIEYFIKRAHTSLHIMDQLDLINRTAELARVFGIDFYSVLSRGSQYRVESMMLRLAHSQNFLAISPSRQQVASQPAMQCLPLVMEPESRFYTDPVVVLDFQSLYPSMMIGYNLCFSTCLGKLVAENPKVLGVTHLNLPAGILNNLKDGLTFTPNGVMFVSPKIRPGVLPRLLDEILSTRIMVKKAMKKLTSTQKVLQRVLNARQLALKLISNVTYGYTAAGFSGRMPCAELADSIVQSGRHTLESAITFVNAHRRWKARVIYGDTDSMFVLLKGRSKEVAFKIGEEIAAAITAMNPHPVTLKMEKVYHPCVLLTKKRYVGYSYESPKQVKPTFDAKGIETVRRDSCGAVAKTLEQTLRILFETRDVSQVKSYLQRQWTRIMNGRISVKDFIFAKEVRLGTYSTRASVLPPAAIVATKAMSVDPRAEPRYGERVPYIVVHGEPGARLVDMVVDPHALLNMTSSFRLHDAYYITKQIIPALQRVFGLLGIDLVNWYSDMPRQIRPPTAKRLVFTYPFSKGLKNVHENENEVHSRSQYKRTIDHYYLSQHCMVCGDLVQAPAAVCTSCLADEVVSATTLVGRLSRLEREFKHLQSICRHCGGGEERDIEEGIGCNSLACSVFFERVKVQKEYNSTATITRLHNCRWLG